MPFITQDRRDVIDKMGILSLEDIKPGDRCYYYYRDMVKKWKASPRWTTAHEIFKDMMFAYGLRWNPVGEHVEWDAAHLLAWQVFFQLYVMPYELDRRNENGDI